MLSDLGSPRPAMVLSYGEILPLVEELDDRWVYSVPQQCGDTHIHAKILILKTKDRGDVGFQTQPVESCVLYARAFWYDDDAYRLRAHEREVYKFRIYKGVTFLIAPEMESCDKMFTPTNHD